ncbi:MATE family efflux transporter [Evansella halocellulosilytica]|uniref:MATE family efflux transporter n=1 Tax=Evansella halocellulosilytica TaxID=2011013 RepID=UPI000BB96707|nr:MATE family efflux transporter [Evansella halocellulosilytica]
MKNTLPQEPTSKEQFKVIFALALPAIIDNFFQTVIGFVDTLFLSQIGLVEVSAVGVTNAILQVYFAVFMSIGVAANIYIAKYIGANDKEKAKHVTQQSIILALIAGVIFGILTLFFAPIFLQLMGAEEEVIASGTIYFQIVAVPSIFISLMFVLGSILRGTGDTKTPMKVSIYINILHIILDYILIFGFLFIPAMGIVGAALATVLVRIVGVIMLWRYIRASKTEIGFFTRDYWKPSKAMQFDLLSMGGPAAGERLVMRIGQVLYFGFIIQLGTHTFAAHQIAGSIEVFSYMIGYGFAAAATTLMGQYIGAGRLQEAKQVGKLITYLAAGIMTVLGVVLFFSAEWLGSFFTNDLDVIREIKIALQIDAFIQPVLGVVLVLTGVFQGGGNTKYPMYITAIGIWVIRTVGVYLLGISLGFGIAGVWIAIGLDNLFRAVILWRKFTRDDWIHEKFFKHTRGKQSGI